jgi:branched-chain amino acid transport system ATP-binding protein
VRETPLLEVRSLCAGYGRSRVLFGIDLAVPAQGAVAVLGRNGAGKTTLMNTIVGEIEAEEGVISFSGADVTHARTERRVRLGIGYVPQEQAIFSRLSVRENLAVGALGSRGRNGLDRAIGLFPKLGERLDQTAGTLSGGERKMLAIGRALLAEPKLIILDEPTEGVWIGVIDEIAGRLAELAREKAVLIVEQHLEVALRVATRVYVLDRGKVVIEGRPAEVRENPQLLTYLAP